MWNRVRNFIEQGVDNFDTSATSWPRLGHEGGKGDAALARDKRTKALAEDAWKKQQVVRRTKEQAKRWLTNLSVPGYQRALQSVPRVLFSLKVGFHGTVALGTLTRPWSPFSQNFGACMFGISPRLCAWSKSPAFYEWRFRTCSPAYNYQRARRAGLQ